MYEIYSITNVVTGKSYIGLTKRTSAKRFEVHLSEARRNLYGMYLHSSMRKHGPDVFTFSVLARCETHEQACVLEIEHIKKLNTLAPYGYNEHAGGKGGCALASESLREKLSLAKKGKPAHNKGKPMSQAQKDKISKANKGQKKSEQHRTSLRVAQQLRREAKKGF